jgi:uncharacterized protein (UPF0305 family)
MYLLYDFLQLRRALLREVLYVKRHVYQLFLQDLESLTTNDLQKIVKQIQEHSQMKNSIILRFLKNITIIDASMSHSYNEKLKMKAQIKDLITRYELSTF